jgi:hypothetical protein
MAIDVWFLVPRVIFHEETPFHSKLLMASYPKKYLRRMKMTGWSLWAEDTIDYFGLCWRVSMNLCGLADTGGDALDDRVIVAG